MTTAPERWLEKIGPQPHRPGLNRTYVAEIAGGKWIVASNGHIAIAEKHSGELDADPFGPKIAAVLEIQGEPLGEFARDDLEWFAGPPLYSTERECRECDGHGTHDCTCGHEHDCHECAGSGFVGTTPDLRHGWVGPVLIDRVKIAQVIAEAPAGPVHVTTAVIPGPSDRIFLDGGSWRAVIMGLRHGDGYPEHADAPRLALPVPA